MLLVVAIGWAVAATVSLLFFPIESDEPPPGTVTVTETITLSQP